MPCALCVALGACAADAPAMPAAPSSVVIENQSQYVLDEVRVHADEDYTQAPNLAKEGGLQVGDTVVFHASQPRYVTVFRVRNRGGPTIAITTDTPLPLEGGSGHRLLVFDDSFRVEESTFISEPTTQNVGTSTSS